VLLLLLPVHLWFDYACHMLVFKLHIQPRLACRPNFTLSETTTKTKLFSKTHLIGQLAVQAAAGAAR
jgi:hypothetical protein